MTARALLLAGGTSVATDPFWTSVSSLLFNDNAANGTTTFADQSTVGTAWARTGTCAYTNSNPPTGLTTSVDFPGSGNIINLSPSTPISAFAFPGDFTFEFYIRFNGLAQVSGVLDFRANGSDTTKCGCDIESSTFVLFKNGIKITGGLPSNLTWCHYAFSRSGSSNILFLNGTQTGSTWTDSTSYGNSIACIGNVVPATNALIGQMASLRITKGVARYTGAFTPPTLPLPNH